MEKRNPVDQHLNSRDPAENPALDRYHRARTFILANARLFATQGSVVATWRRRGPKNYGPYYRLAYRLRGRQRSIYLGARQAAHLLRELLAQLQLPHRRRRLYKRLQAKARVSLRQAKNHLAQQLAPLGVTLKGYEFRGVTRAFPKYRHKTPYY